MITNNELKDYMVCNGKIRFKITSLENLKEITIVKSQTRINAYRGNNSEIKQELSLPFKKGVLVLNNLDIDEALFEPYQVKVYLVCDII